MRICNIWISDIYCENENVAIWKRNAKKKIYKKARKNDEIEVVDNFMVRFTLPLEAVANHAKKKKKAHPKQKQIGK